MSDARAIAEQTARASYGRLLAWLSARTRDVSSAEDALSEAFRAALEHWPQTGVPSSPEAWIITAARRKLIDSARRSTTRTAASSQLILAAEEAEARICSDVSIPDERLKLMFICAHPAIDESVRTPLMLQTVLGLDAARIASAFLTSPNAMSARLVRAKRKIKAAAIPFTEPPLEEMDLRIGAVLDAVYAAFGAGWDAHESSPGGDLTGEALFLAKVLTDVAPDQPEAWGLLSLMAHAEARRQARLVKGVYIPLSEQDVSLWDQELILFAENALSKAWSLKRTGRYQLEAAIQSAHAMSLLSGRDVSKDTIRLYESLLQYAPSIGAYIGYAAALSSSNRHKDGLEVLDRIDPKIVNTHQPYWAVRAHILKALGEKTLSVAAYDRAVGLSTHEAVRCFLRQQLNAPA